MLHIDTKDMQRNENLLGVNWYQILVVDAGDRRTVILQVSPPKYSKFRSGSYFKILNATDIGLLGQNKL